MIPISPPILNIQSLARLSVSIFLAKGGDPFVNRLSCDRSGDLSKLSHDRFSGISPYELVCTIPLPRQQFLSCDLDSMSCDLVSIGISYDFPLVVDSGDFLVPLSSDFDLIVCDFSLTMGSCDFVSCDLPPLVDEEMML